MPTLNYTTTVAAERTIVEIHKLLVNHGAQAIITHYSEQRPVGLAFRLMTAHGMRDFSLPINEDAVFALLEGQNLAARYQGHDRALMVAWRILRSWLEAQLAIIETQMVSFDEVMLPYMHIGSDLTVYQMYVEHEDSLVHELTAGPS